MGGAGERLGGGGSSSVGASEVQAATIRALYVLLKKESARSLLASHGGVGYLAKVLKGKCESTVLLGLEAEPTKPKGG